MYCSHQIEVMKQQTLSSPQGDCLSDGSPTSSLLQGVLLLCHVREGDPVSAHTLPAHPIHCEPSDRSQRRGRTTSRFMEEEEEGAEMLQVILPVAL